MSVFHRGVARHTLTMLVFLFLLLLMATAYAQDGNVTDDDVNAIAKKMYCPVCENIPLDVCGTAACAQWRDEIRIQLEQGLSADQIIADFVGRYGDRVVGTPQDPTLRALSLVTPWIMGAAILLVVVWLLVRWQRSRSADTGFTVASGGSATMSDDDYRARLEADLKAKR